MAGTMALLWLAAGAFAQTAKEFTLNLTDDGAAQMRCFLPQNPSGKAIVGVPGGGYSVLSNTHEGTLAAEWMNQRGIAYFVVNYRLPNGDRTKPIGDVEKGIRTVRDSAAVWGINPHDVGIMVISRRSSPRIRRLKCALTSPFCFILSSRWMSVCRTSGRAAISWVRRGRKTLSWCASSLQIRRCAAI